MRTMHRTSLACARSFGHRSGQLRAEAMAEALAASSKVGQPSSPPLAPRLSIIIPATPQSERSLSSSWKMVPVPPGSASLLPSATSDSLSRNWRLCRTHLRACSYESSVAMSERKRQAASTHCWRSSPSDMAGSGTGSSAMGSPVSRDVWSWVMRLWRCAKDMPRAFAPTDHSSTRLVSMSRALSVLSNRFVTSACSLRAAARRSLWDWISASRRASFLASTCSTVEGLAGSARCGGGAEPRGERGI
mmetsp:Transcript_18965/g.50996  ORF Transcript_18965/g.50996 Transcript_18965/m.50996 type:complete len:247 (+) Transcript_18965:318-1058(+)